MDVIILAGGYAKRLKPISDFIPKALLPIGGIPLLDYILQSVRGLYPRRIIISTNKKFENHFKYWLSHKNLENIILVVEPTRREEEKFGAIAGLWYAIDKVKVEDDLLVIAGDNFFDFDLIEIIEKMRKERRIVIALYDIGSYEEARRFGVAIVDGERIIGFQEKPSNPKSTLISTGIYVFPKEKIFLIKEYLEKGNYRDSLGKFFEWVLEREELAYVIYKGIWFDIGTLEAYRRVCEYVESHPDYFFKMFKISLEKFSRG